MFLDIDKYFRQRKINKENVQNLFIKNEMTILINQKFDFNYCSFKILLFVLFLVIYYFII